MILLENLTDLLISVDLLEKIAIYLTDKDIELILGDDDFIQAMNHKFRRKNDPTDVLSFPIRGDRENEPIGSIIISMDQVVVAGCNACTSSSYDRGEVGVCRRRRLVQDQV
jgi:probable rRNA maturation factor